MSKKPKCWRGYIDRDDWCIDIIQICEGNPKYATHTIVPDGADMPQDRATKRLIAAALKWEAAPFISDHASIPDRSDCEDLLRVAAQAFLSKHPQRKRKGK